MPRSCGHAYFAQESQCPFASGHAMDQNIVGVVIEDEREEIQSGDILYGVFASYAFCQGCVAANLVAYCCKFFENMAVCPAEFLPRSFVGSIQYGAVGKNDAQRQ